MIDAFTMFDSRQGIHAGSKQFRRLAYLIDETGKIRDETDIYPLIYHPSPRFFAIFDAMIRGKYTISALFSEPQLDRMATD